MDDSQAIPDACVYCGSTEQLTDDHVPPKLLFPKPRPSNLITVPSCRTCNEGASKDDEYFRLMLSMRDDTGDHPAVKQILPAVYRSLEKPTKKGLQKSLLDSTFDVDRISPGGIYLGEGLGYDVDLARLDRVAARITKGLFYHHFARPLPSHFHVVAYTTDGLDRIDSQDKAKVLRMFDIATRNEPQKIGDGVFSYWQQLAQGHDTAGIWVLVFYQRVSFLCLVVPKQSGAPTN